MNDSPSADTSHTAAARYRLHRAGIHNVWQYDNQVFHFADGRLLLRGRNGAGKSKALEILLPFLLDGDARRLDTAGNGRTTLRWLLRGAMSRAGAEDDEGVVLGHAWVEFARTDGDTRHHLTLGAAVSSASDEEEARCLFYVTDRQVGEDLTLVRDGRPLPADEVRAELGEDNTFTSPAQYRARVMDELFGLDDPRRYRNLVHLLYRLRRPTIGERLEAGELATVLAEALPPTDELVLDTVGRNLTDLESARSHLSGLRSTRDHVAEFIQDYSRYLYGVIRGRTGAVRGQLEDHTRRTDEVERLAAELATLVAAESSAQEERDRVRRTRDTAEGDGSVLEAAAQAAEERDRRMVINAFIRTARAAWHAAEYARSAEENSQDSLAKSVAALNDQLDALRPTSESLSQSLRDAGLPPEPWGEIPQTDPTVLAPRESTTAVDLEGLEHAVERAPVPGVDAGALRGRLARLHDELAHCAQQADERDAAADSLLGVLDTLDTAHTRADALADEAEWADRTLADAHDRRKAAEERFTLARGEYVEQMHQWCERLRTIVADPHLGTTLAPMIDRMRTRGDAGQLSPDDDTDAAVRSLVTPHLEGLRDRRDVAVGEARELRLELDELAERRTALEKADDTSDHGDDAGEDGLPLFRAVEFAADLDEDHQAGLEAALEGSGLLTARITADGSVVEPETNRLLLSPRSSLSGRTLFDVLRPREHPTSGVSAATIAEVLTSVAVEGLPVGSAPELEPSTKSAECALSVQGHWRLGVLSGTATKSAPELVGERARSTTRERDLAKLDRRIAIAEALLAEAKERCAGLENQTDELAAALASAPAKVNLAGAAAIAHQLRADHETARTDAATAAETARTARQEALELRRQADAAAEAHALPVDSGDLTAVRNAIHRARTFLSGLRRDLTVVARRVEDYRASVGTWEEHRRRRISAEDFRTQAIQDMISVRRQIELTERARSAHPDQLIQAGDQVRERGAEAASRLPELERTAQRARDERVAAEARLAMARAEQAEQARRVLRAGRDLRKAFAHPDASAGLDRCILTATGLDRIAGGLQASTTDVEDDAEPTTELGIQVRQLAAFTAAVEAGLPEDAEPLDDSTILRRHDDLQQRLGKAGAHARSRLTEHNGVKRVTLEAGQDECDIIEYAERLDKDIAQAEETASLREEEAYERHLLGELAGHLGQQIEESKALVATMNTLLGGVTTSQGLGVRLDWTIAADADEDIRAVVPLLERPPEQRTRLEATRLRDALRRCIEAIRRLDPGSTQGAQLRAALDYRSWFEFTVYVTDTRSGREERRLSHRTGLSQGEQRVVAYLVLFAAAAAEFSALGRRSDRAPRLILLDDAFAKVDEPTHGRLLGLLSELDLDFVLTSERLWGCFPSVPSLEIYECLRDPEVPGISTMRFSWDGTRRSLQD